MDRSLLEIVFKVFSHLPCSSFRGGVQGSATCWISSASATPKYNCLKFE